MASLLIILILFPCCSLKHVPPEVRYPPGWVADPALSQQMEVVSVPVLETWTAMESLVHRGLVRWRYPYSLSLLLVVI